MDVVALTNKEKKVYKTFSKLRLCASDANIDTLKQISSYVAKTTDDNFDFDLNCVCKKYCFGESGFNYLLSLDDGRKITFSSDKSCFDFFVYKYGDDTHMSMSISVFERIPGDLSTTSVYGEVRVEDAGKYVVTFRPNDLSDDTLKYGTINYFSGDEIDWVYTIVDSVKSRRDFDLLAKENDIYPFAEKSYFDLFYESDMLDNLGGYVVNSMARIDLLLSNIEILRKNALAKKKRK